MYLRLCWLDSWPPPRRQSLMRLVTPSVKSKQHHATILRARRRNEGANEGATHSARAAGSAAGVPRWSPASSLHTITQSHPAGWISLHSKCPQCPVAGTDGTALMFSAMRLETKMRKRKNRCHPWWHNSADITHFLRTFPRFSFCPAKETYWP